MNTTTLVLTGIILFLLMLLGIVWKALRTTTDELKSMAPMLPIEIDPKDPIQLADDRRVLSFEEDWFDD